MPQLPASADLWLNVKAAVSHLIAHAPEIEAEVILIDRMPKDLTPQKGSIVLRGIPHLSSWDFATVYDRETHEKLGLLGSRDLEWEDDESQLYEFQPLTRTMRLGMVRLVASTIEYERVLDTLEDDELGARANLERLAPVMLNPGAYLSRLNLQIPFTPPRARLNPEQLDAVRLALSEAPVTLIEGPPGTGKTTVITEIIRQAILAGRRVLCISPTHQAVDNVISRLEREDLPFVPIRVGHADRVGHSELTEANRTETIERYLREKRLPQSRLTATLHSHHQDPLLAQFSQPEAIEALLALLDAHGDQLSVLEEKLHPLLPEGLSEARLRLFIEHATAQAPFLLEKLRLARAFPRLDDEAVSTLGRFLDQRGGSPVFGTAVGFVAAWRLLSPQPGETLPFDLLIVDEASKMTLPQFLLGALRAKKAILVGDSHQLPPFVNAGEQAILLEKGVPEGLVTRSIFRHLELTLLPCYKVSLPRQYRMHRDIVHFSNWAFYQGRLRTGRGDGINYLEKRYRVTWMDVRGSEEKGGSSWFNRGELNRIRKLLQELDHKLAGQSGLRTVGVLSFYKEQKRRIERMLEELPLNHLRPVAGTVDSFQGEEMDIVIISFVRTRKIGFLNNAERLNVALTRAKDYMFLLGDARFYQNPEFIISGIFHHPALGREQHI